MRRTKGDVSAIRKGEEWFDEIQAYEAQYVSPSAITVRMLSTY